MKTIFVFIIIILFIVISILVLNENCVEVYGYDATKNSNIYITEAEYNILLNDLNQQLDNLMKSDASINNVGPVPSVDKIIDKINKLKENREWSKKHKSLYIN
jgi:preprotein translocase subunit SecF